jgi:hypothetical protein
MNHVEGLISHPHDSDASITSPQEAMQYLRQLGSNALLQTAPPAALLNKDEPRAWVRPVVTPPDGQTPYILNWSGTPHDKWDWAGMFMKIHHTSDFFFAENPPVMTAPDGTKYVTGEQILVWQWANNGNTYDTHVTEDYLAGKRGPEFSWKHGEKEPYARYFSWDYESKAWATRGEPVAVA